MKRTIPIFASLLLLCSAAVAQITGPETVKPGDLVHLTIPAPPGADVVFEVVEPNDIDFLEYRDGTTAHFVCPAGCVARKIRVLALSINFDSKSIKRERHTIIVEGDVVVVPDPPGPGPGPQPTPKLSVRVLILTEQDGPHKVPAPQAAAMSAAKVIETLNAKCPKELTSDGKQAPAWRILDDDLTATDLSLLPTGFKDLYARGVSDAKGQVPWVIATSPLKGTVSRAYPATVEEAVSFFQSL